MLQWPSSVRKRDENDRIRGYRWRILVATLRLMDRHFLLSRSEWRSVFQDREVEATLRLALIGGVALYAHGTLQQVELQGRDVPNLFVALAAGATFFCSFGRWKSQLFFVVPLLVIIINLIFVAENLSLTFMDPGELDLLKCLIAPMLFAMNSAVMKPLRALIVNLIVFVSISALGFAHLLATQGGGGAATQSITALLLLACGLVMQYFAIKVYEQSVQQLAAARRAMAEMDARQQFVAENLRVREELARLNRVTVVEAMSTSFAHEMNQPIGSALTFAQAARRWLAKDPPKNVEAMAAIDRAVVQIDRAGHIIATIRGMTARVPNRPRLVDIRKQVAMLADMINGVLRERQVKFEVVTGRDVPLTVNICVEEISQVLLNLVNNAVEAFSPEQQNRNIRLEVRQATAGWLDFLVIDNGPGLAGSELDQIFDSFYTTKSGGTGLGLAICRDIAEGSGGSIFAESQPGAGVQITFRIPLICAATAETGAEYRQDVEVSPLPTDWAGRPPSR